MSDRYLHSVDSGIPRRDESKPVFLWSSALFSFLHLSSGTASGIHSGIKAMCVANLSAGILFTGMVLISRLNFRKFPWNNILIILLVIDNATLFILNGGTTGSAIYLSIPAIISSMLILPLRIRPVIPALWALLFAGLFSFQYYHPEYILSQTIFFDGFFDTVIAVLLGFAYSGILIIVYSRSGEKIRAQYNNMAEQAESRRMEFETYSMDFPIRINNEISRILSEALSPLNSALNGKLGKRINRGVLASIKADTERAMLYLQNIKYLALLEHGITEHFSLAVDLDTVILESSQEFHERYGQALPRIVSDGDDDIHINTCDTYMLRLGILNILRICTPDIKANSGVYIYTHYSQDTATIAFSASSPEEESFIAGLFEILDTDAEDPFAIYEESWLCLTVAKKIFEAHYGKIFMDALHWPPGSEENSPCITVKLPLL